MRGIKYFDKKNYVHAEGEDSEADSSDEKYDHLSYSYSCVKSFRKNQHIIGDLAALHKAREYQGTSHEPALFTLSGQRNKVVCQPFYCGSDGERSYSSEEEQQNCRQQHEIVAKEIHTQSGTSQHQFPVKEMLVQWMKHQFKQVNSFLKSNIPKDTFIPGFCKKNQNMKMEMTLNGVDEETKYRLIDYIKKFNLGFEEHCNICTGNETVFEIDVTSILDNPARLQSFLTYIKSIDPERYKAPNTELTSNLKGDLKQPSEEQVEKMITGIYQKNQNLNCETKTIRRKKVLEENKRPTYQTHSFFAASKECQDGYVIKEKKHNSKQERIYSVCDEERQPQSYHKSVEIDGYTNCNVGKKQVSHELIFPESADVVKGKKKFRKTSTLSKANGSHNTWNDQQEVVFEEKSQFYPKNVPLEQNIFNIQTYNNKNQSHVNRELSCKCLIHNDREDIYRYKTQCLFGKGDEINNSFIKYIDKNVETPKPSLANKNELNYFKDENNEKDGSEVLTALLPAESARRKICYTCTDLSQNTSLVKSKYVDLNAHQDVTTKAALDTENEKRDSPRESFCLIKCSSSSTDINTFSKSRDLKMIATNACFKSLSYCIESFPNMKTNDEFSGREAERGKQSCSLLNRCKCSFLNEKSTDGPIGSIDMHCNVGAHDKTMQAKKHSTANCLHGVDRELFKKLPGKNENTVTNKIQLEKVVRESNVITSNAREPQEFDEKNCSAIDNIEDYVDKSKTNHSIFSTTCIPVSNEHEKINDLFFKTTIKNVDSEMCSQHIETNKCCIVGCDCNKINKRTSKVKTIVFRIGSSNKELKVSCIPPSTKRKSKLKSLKAKEVCGKISSVFKGNDSTKIEKCLNNLLNDEKSIKNLHGFVTEEKSTTDGLDTKSSSMVNCQDCSLCSLTSQSKETLQTSNSLDVGSSSTIENSLRILISELKSQRMEINFMKTLIARQITSLKKQG